MADDVGVDCIAALIARAGSRSFAQGRGDPVGADIAIAIPQRLAVLDAHRVDHAIAGKPVVGLAIWRDDWVGSDPHVGAIKLDRQRTPHRQPLHDQFVPDRSIGALQIGILMIALSVSRIS